MIPNQWYVILESSEVKPGKPVGVTRMGEKLVAWRNAQGQVTVMSERCPHRGAALSAGKLKGDCLCCPFHGFEFDSAGRARLIPANGRKTQPPQAMQVKTYPTREMNDFIFIWWGAPRAEYPPLPWFEVIDHQRCSWMTLRDHWKVHYSRAVENQLDVLHLPFVHHNTIGRGNLTLVNGPVTEIKELPGGSLLLNLWLDNELDQGQTPLSPRQMSIPNRSPLLQFFFPNLWQIWLADDLHIVLAFAPVDDENTFVYLRNYQGFVTAPILRDVFNLFSAVGNSVIIRQDKRVVETQLPKRSALKGGEVLVQGDGPIIEYRRRRQALLEAAQVQS